MGFKSGNFRVAMTCEVEGTQVELKLKTTLLEREKQSEFFISSFIQGSFCSRSRNPLIPRASH